MKVATWATLMTCYGIEQCAIEFSDYQAIATIDLGKFGLLPLFARCNVPNSTYDPFRY